MPASKGRFTILRYSKQTVRIVSARIASQMDRNDALCHYGCCRDHGNGQLHSKPNRRENSHPLARRVRLSCACVPKWRRWRSLIARALRPSRLFSTLCPSQVSVNSLITKVNVFLPSEAYPHIVFLRCSFALCGMPITMAQALRTAATTASPRP